MTRKTKEQLQVELNSIRELRRKPKTDIEIMSELKIPYSTYYWYLKQIREEDKKYIDTEMKESISHEVRNLQDKLIILEQQANKVLDSEKTSTRDKLESIRLIKELSSDRVKLLIEGPEVLSNTIRRQTNSISEETKEQT